MASQKPKGFGKPLHHKRQEQELQKFTKRLRNNLGDWAQHTIIAPAGMLKMSEVLGAFAEPYTKSLDNYSDCVKCIEMAAVAWNLALMPEEQRQPFLDASINKAMPDSDAFTLQEFRDIIAEMVERKLTHFADYDRIIANFEMKNTGDGFHLSVASVVTEDPTGKS